MFISIYPGSSKSAPNDEDEVLNQILGQTSDKVASRQKSVGIASSSSTSNYDGEIQNIVSNDKPNLLGIDLESTTPEELRKQALEEKKQHRILKGEGKSGEAMRAFKRGKELERQADALEIQLRKNRKKSLPSGNLSDLHNKGDPVESDRKTKSLSHVGREKDDLTSELRELGWSDMDLRNEDKKSSNLSLEGELSSIIGEIFTKTGEQKVSRIDKSQVVALKKNALQLKREGKLVEAKEELKRAKILEKELEEQELLAGAEDSDDELSALIRGMEDDKELPNLHDHGHGFDFERLLAASDDLDGNFEVTDDDMMDPEIAGALESLGWTEPENTSSKSQTFNKEALLDEIQSLKREALNQKRAGNAEEARAFLKKAKLLERDLNSSGPEDYNMSQKSTSVRKSVISEIAGNGSDSIKLDERNTRATNNISSTVAPKSRLMIQRELLSLKKKALTLRREGKMNEAEEEMQKGAALERQLMEMDKASNLKTSHMNTADNVPVTVHKHSDFSINLALEEGGEDDVTEQDMSDPTYLSLLRDMGWNDNNKELSNSPSKPSKKDGNHFVPVNDTSISKHSANVSVQPPRSKAEIQRKLLGLKRKALALRREGKVEDAEEVLKMSKALEAQMVEMEAAKNKAQIVAPVMKDGLFNPPADEESDVVVSEEDMHDLTLNSMLSNLGWKDDEFEPVTIKAETVKEATSRSTHTVDSSAASKLSSSIPATPSRNKGEIQRELLGLKRKALAFRRKGEIEEADEILRQAKTLEAQLEDFENKNKDLSLNVSKDKESLWSKSPDFEERHGNLGVATEVDNASVSSLVWSSKNSSESTFGLERMNNETNIMKSDNLLSATSHFVDGKHSLTAEERTSSENLSKRMKAEKTIGHGSPVDHSMDMVGLVAGDSNSSEILTQKHKEGKLASTNSSQAGPAIHLDSKDNFGQYEGYKNSDTTQKGEMTDVIEKPNINKSNSVQDYASQNHLTLRQEILAHKRKAVSLKREGKLSEAKKELLQAKLLEKELEDGSMQPETASVSNVSQASNVVEKKQESSNVVEKKQESSNVSSKPLSSRDRFKLQQESLGHKRQALKLRREGRTEEAEALFERAKAIETQLEESTAQDSNKSDGVDDVTIEDFLDPQLLSALKAVGLDDIGVVSKAPERQETVKSNAKVENSNQERIQLEERIKEEKVKALNLKRSGKQAEALDALRRAKLYEKKLNSLTSG